MLFIGQVFAGGLLAVQALQLGDLGLQLLKAKGGDVVRLFADLTLNRRIGLIGGAVFVYKCTAHDGSPFVNRYLL